MIKAGLRGVKEWAGIRYLNDLEESKSGVVHHFALLELEITNCDFKLGRLAGLAPLGAKCL